jgi:hypothetical protein
MEISFKQNLPQYGFRVLALSEPYDPVSIDSALKQGTQLPCEGEELMVVARRNNI